VDGMALPGSHATTTIQLPRVSLLMIPQLFAYPWCSLRGVPIWMATINTGEGLMPNILFLCLSLYYNGWIPVH
jgi:hypothetical protein